MTDITLRRASAEFSSILSGAILRRAFIVALAIGSVLTLVNQFGAVAGDGDLELLPIVLVYLTPFVVIAVSQVVGIWRAMLDAASGHLTPALREGLLATARSHGIPRRAVALGLLAGSVNTSITVATGLLESGAVGPLPVALLAQAFTLPIIFGLLSQALAYRRAAGSISHGSAETA